MPREKYANLTRYLGPMTLEGNSLDGMGEKLTRVRLYIAWNVYLEMLNFYNIRGNWSYISAR